MGPMCIPVYRAMEQLAPEFPHVAFRDLEFDIPAAEFIKSQPKCAGFMGIPFTVYFRNGEAVVATSSIQSKGDISQILDALFDEP
jgi:thioredoxin 1